MAATGPLGTRARVRRDDLVAGRAFARDARYSGRQLKNIDVAVPTEQTCRAAHRHEGVGNGMILVIEGDPLQRTDIQALMTRLGHEVESADSPDAALAAMGSRCPELVVLDVETGGLVLCAEIAESPSATPVILISGQRTTADDRVAGFLAGADDYVCKPFYADELLARARRTLVRRVAGLTLPPTPATSTLSPREHQVLRLLVNGRTQRQIAADLVISTKTVGTHLQHILSKLGVHSRAQAIAYALTSELCTQPSNDGVR
jgi:two-component system, NarL family, nitrate/nitrite response regulator NarL